MVKTVGIQNNILLEKRTINALLRIINLLCFFFLLFKIIVYVIIIHKFMHKIFSNLPFMH